MATLLEDDTFKYIFGNSDSNFIEIVSLESNSNKQALVQVMAWHQRGDKPLPEPMLTQYIDAYMRH